MNVMKGWRQSLASALGVLVSLAIICSITAMAAYVAEKAVSAGMYPLLCASGLALVGAYFAAKPSAEWVRKTVSQLTGSQD